MFGINLALSICSLISPSSILGFDYCSVQFDLCVKVQFVLCYSCHSIIVHNEEQWQDLLLFSSSLIDEVYHICLVGKMNMNDCGWTQYLLCIYQNYLNANFAYK